MKIVFVKNIEKTIYKKKFCERCMLHRFPQFPEEGKYLTNVIYAIKGKYVDDSRVKAELSSETAYVFSLKNGVLRPWHVTYKASTLANFERQARKFHSHEEW